MKGLRSASWPYSVIPPDEKEITEGTFGTRIVFFDCKLKKKTKKTATVICTSYVQSTGHRQYDPKLKRATHSRNSYQNLTYRLLAQKMKLFIPSKDKFYIDSLMVTLLILSRATNFLWI